jgi:hypothetical protein
MIEMAIFSRLSKRCGKELGQLMGWSAALAGQHGRGIKKR